MCQLAFYCYDQHHDPKQHGQERVLRLTGHTPSKEVRKLEAGTETRSTPLHPASFTTFLMQLRTTCLRWYRPRPKSIIKKVPQRQIIKGQSDEGMFSNVVLPSQMILVMSSYTHTHTHAHKHTHIHAHKHTHNPTSIMSNSDPSPNPMIKNVLLNLLY